MPSYLAAGRCKPVLLVFGHIEKNSRWIGKKNSRIFPQNSIKFIKEEHFRICIVKTNFFSQWALWTKSSSGTPRNPKKVTGESAKKSSGLPSDALSLEWERFLPQILQVLPVGIAIGEPHLARLWAAGVPLQAGTAPSGQWRIGNAL